MPLSGWLVALLCVPALLGGDRIWIRLAADGWAEPSLQAPKNLDDGSALWTWAADCAPHRQTTLDDAPCGALTETAVRVVAPRRTTAPSEIRWGTEAMIRELPDALLPVASTDAGGRAAFRVPKDATVFARVAGPELASGWVEVRSERAIRAVEAIRASLRVVDETGTLASRARVELRTADAAQPHKLAFRAAGDGAVALPAIPANAFLKLLVWSDRAAPLVITAPAQKLPQRVALPSGFSLAGRVIDEGKSAVAGATVTSTFLVSGEETPIQKRAVTDRKGTWRIAGIPSAADVEWNVSRQPYAGSSHIVRVTGDVDLGDATLWRARDVAVRVVDERGAAVEQAKIGTTDGAVATTNARGVATLRTVPAAAFNASVVATGYRKARVRVPEKLDKPLPITLQRAARLRARIVSADDGKPAGPGTVAVQFNERKTLEDFDAGGELKVDDLDAGTVSLEIRAAGRAPFRIPPRTVAAGESIDLGTIALERGLSLAGRAVDAASGGPLAGVVVRALRPNSFGPLLSYVRQDWVSAESDADGVFRLHGLAPGVYSIWTEAAAHAPLVKTGISVAALPAGGEVDLGELQIPEAHLLRVRCEPVARCGSEASVLLAGSDWLPLRSSIADGTADVGPVPAGQARLRLADRRGIIHERDVAIAADDAVTEIAVQLPAVTIAGTVTRAGEPVAGGTVTLTNAPDWESRPIQMATPRAAGMIGNDMLGSVPRQVSAPVSQDGRFEVRDAAPGEYDVVWSSDGWPSPPKRVSVPESSTASISIEIAGATVSGSVRAGDGSTPRRVLVALEQRGRRAQTLASSDGSFSFLGVEPGPAFVRATDIGGATAERQIAVNDEAERVDLTLDQPSKQPAAVLVTSRGVPLPNAFVFLRSTGGMRAATSTDDGRASFELRASEQILGIAVFSATAGWGFAPPPASSAAEARIDVPGAIGGLVIRTAGSSAPVVVESPSGFPIQEALATLGIPPVAYAASPLRLTGVPAGTYRIVSGGVTRTERVGDRVHEVDF